MVVARLVVVALVAFVLGITTPARAHGMRSAYLEIVEESGGNALARFRLTVPAPGVEPVVPVGCKATDLGGAERTDSGVVRSLRLACSGSLRGASVGVAGLGPTITEAVVRVTLADGLVHAGLLSAAEPSMVVPAEGSAWTVARDFVGQGLRHIAEGADHLLFLLLLVLTLKKPRPVLAAEAAFTVSHTLSFAVTALGLVRVSAQAAEACIALSLLLVALDLGRKGHETSTARASALALAFGVVHGLGFAGGLREIGLPADHAASALLGFGAGVEIGQLAFCLVGLGAVWALGRWRHEQKVVQLVAYGSGALSAAWLFERLGLCLQVSR